MVAGTAASCVAVIVAGVAVSGTVVTEHVVATAVAAVSGIDMAKMSL